MRSREGQLSSGRCRGEVDALWKNVWVEQRCAFRALHRGESVSEERDEGGGEGGGNAPRRPAQTRSSSTGTLAGDSPSYRAAAQATQSHERVRRESESWLLPTSSLVALSLFRYKAKEGHAATLASPSSLTSTWPSRALPPRASRSTTGTSSRPSRPTSSRPYSASRRPMHASQSRPMCVDRPQPL